MEDEMAIRTLKNLKVADLQSELAFVQDLREAEEKEKGHTHKVSFLKGKEKAYLEAMKIIKQ